jgi:hypothetical protein
VSFLYPLFISAALLIAIPIIIHLFNFRKYKKIYFSDIRFLKEIKEQTTKSSKLKNLLILASRILGLLAIIFAFAQPYISKNNQEIANGPKAISIYIDNSFSMSLQENGISQLDIAKSKAKNIIESFGEADKFHLLTNEFGMNENKFLTQKEALAQLGQVYFSAKPRNTITILEKQKKILKTEPGYGASLAFISDFQKSTFQTNLNNSATENDTIPKYFISVESKQKNNIYIDTAILENPNLQLQQTNPIRVKIVNNSNEQKESTLTLQVNNQLKSVKNISLKANSKQESVLEFSPSKAGFQNIKLFLNDYPINFDDTFYISAKVVSNFSVLILNQQNANAYLSSVFKPSAQFRVENNNVNSFDAKNSSNYSLIILNSVNQLSENLQKSLKDYLSNGGSVMVFAPVQNGIGNLNSFLSATANCQYFEKDSSKNPVSNFQKTHPLFTDVFEKFPTNIDLPVAYQYYNFSASSLSAEQKLFSFSNGNSFLSSFKVDNGKMYVCASSAENNSSTFPNSYWFLPMFYKMAFSTGNGAVYSKTIGKNALLTIPNTNRNKESVYSIKKDNFEAIPPQNAYGNMLQLDLSKATNNAGIYSIYLKNNPDSLYCGLNYDRKESDMNYWNIADLKSSLKLKNIHFIDSITPGEEMNSLSQGIPLWKVCIILALLFLLTEILLIRYLK